MVYAAISDLSKEGIYFGQMGNWKGRIRGFFRPRSGDPAFLFKPSDLAPEFIRFGLIPAGDPNGPLIRTQNDLDQRPTPERCFEALPPPADVVRGDRGAQARRRQRTDAGLGISCPGRPEGRVTDREGRLLVRGTVISRRAVE